MSMSLHTHFALHLHIVRLCVMAFRLLELWLLTFFIPRLLAGDGEYVTKIQAGMTDKEYLVKATGGNISIKLEFDLLECRRYISRVCLCYKSATPDDILLNRDACPNDEGICLWFDGGDQIAGLPPLKFGSSYKHAQVHLMHIYKDHFTASTLKLNLVERGNRLHVIRPDGKNWYRKYNEDIDQENYGSFASALNRYETMDLWDGTKVEAYRMRFLSRPFRCPATFEFLNTRLVDVRNVSITQEDGSTVWKILSYEEYQKFAKKTEAPIETSTTEKTEANIDTRTTEKTETTSETRTTAKTEAHSKTSTSSTLTPALRNATRTTETAADNVEEAESGRYYFIPFGMVSLLVAITTMYVSTGMTMWNRWCCFNGMDPEKRAFGGADADEEGQTSPAIAHSPGPTKDGHHKASRILIASPNERASEKSDFVNSAYIDDKHDKHLVRSQLLCAVNKKKKNRESSARNTKKTVETSVVKTGSENESRVKIKARPKRKTRTNTKSKSKTKSKDSTTSKDHDKSKPAGAKKFAQKKTNTTSKSTRKSKDSTTSKNHEKSKPSGSKKSGRKGGKQKPPMYKRPRKISRKMQSTTSVAEPSIENHTVAHDFENVDYLLSSETGDTTRTVPIPLETTTSRKDNSVRAARATTANTAKSNAGKKNLLDEPELFTAEDSSLDRDYAKFPAKRHKTKTERPMFYRCFAIVTAIYVLCISALFITTVVIYGVFLKR